MMDWPTIISFTLVVTLLVISPGPNGVLIAKTVPTSGKQTGFANIAGFITAFYLHGALSIFGISLILVHSSKAFFIFKMLGAAYLCWLGIRALIEAYRAGCEPKGPYKTIRQAKRKRTLTKAYLEGVLTNLLNPKVAMFYLAAFPQFIAPTENGFSAAMILVTLHSLVNLLWFTIIILLFSKLSGAASSQRFKRWLKGITGVVFVGFGLKLATIRAS